MFQQYLQGISIKHYHYPTNPNSTPHQHRKHKTSVIIGAVIGSLVSLLLLCGGGAFLFIRQRKHRNLKHRLLSNPKIIPGFNSHSPPVRDKNSEIMLEGEMTPNLGDRSPDIVERSPEGNLTDDDGERRNSIETRLRVNTSELQSARQEAPPQAALGDVVAEVLRLRTQFQHFIEREAERAQATVLDPPPAYM
ncbi:hypothetical protein EV421DRAFT_1743578 [Armillaria borealis]|uniref:Uncharacterized protein n=1 Tax=Armillaria borealis TaxID=47425 RepID=A0AA39IUV2_9AGAR|nr:hypothetical protein EV421DRAFT_1743578 [Armillaria borealis]